jgi:hypothetical protein
MPVIAQARIDIEWEPGFPVTQKRQIARQFKLMQAGGNIEDDFISYNAFTPKDPFDYIARLRNAPGVIEASIGSPYAPGEVLPSVFGLDQYDPYSPGAGVGTVMGTLAGAAIGFATDHIGFALLGAFIVRALAARAVNANPDPSMYI